MLESERLGGKNPFSEIEPDNLAQGSLDSDFRRLAGYLGPIENPV